jgi:DNA-binding transcriptional ArsR family regulator
MITKVYSALSDPTRRKIMQLLRERDMMAGELSDHFEFTKPTLSRHFSVLKEADLIQGTKKGNQIIYRLNVTVLEEALMGMMETFNLGDNKASNAPVRLDSSKE